MRGTIIATNLDLQYVTVSCGDGAAYRVDFAELPGHVHPELRTPVGLHLAFALSPRDLKACGVCTIAGIS